MAKGPKVTVGVCGGVAAYRAVELVRVLQESGLDPHVVLTASAERFVTPLTFAAVSGHTVISTLWSGGEIPEDVDGEPPASSVEHIQQAQTTRALIVVPATANILAKLAHGIADDFLTTLYTATRAPVVIAPAMNVQMWEHPAVQANVSTLRQHGATVVEPGAGYLACGMQGAGRLAALPEIVRATLDAMADKEQAPAQDLRGETVLVTAGGTREPVDAVRFLGNRSSGRMGHALAAEALRRGARVILITASPLAPERGIETIRVETSAEMRAAVHAWLPEATIVLAAAAVADFRPVAPFAGKQPRTAGFMLELEPTEDIVAEAAVRRAPGTVVLAFAAEHGADDQAAAKARARAKMQRKGVDAIVLNDISVPGLGFDSEQNAGILLTADGEQEIPPMSKQAMAAHVLDQAMRLRRRTPDLTPELSSAGAKA